MSLARCPVRIRFGQSPPDSQGHRATRAARGRCEHMGPGGSAAAHTRAEERYDRELAAARESFPEWEIRELHGGLIAIPLGTETVSAVTLDGLVRKLREHR